MAKKLALNSKIGVLGEDIAVKFLAKHGFSITFRNYWKKWGEIDIVAKKGEKIHFVEVKSVSCENISRVTVNPAENVTPRKLTRLHRTIQSYLKEFHVKEEWQIDVVLVYVSSENTEAKVEVLENITL